MEQVKVKELATEFEVKSTFVIAELKKIGVWVPSADTEVDTDIANRIRKRLQMLAEAEQEEKEKKAEKAAAKKKPAAPKAKTRRTIRELGKPRKRTAARKKKKKEKEEEPIESSLLSTTMKPRKGKKTSYRRAEPVAETGEEATGKQKTEVSIDDEPLIERVEATASAELLEKQRQPSADELRAALAKSRPAPVKAEEVTEKAAEAEEVAETPVEAKKEAAAEAGAETAEVSEAATAEPPVAEVGEEVEEGPVAEAVAPESEEAPVSPPETVSEEPREITFSEKVTVKVLSERLRVRSNLVIAELMKLGVMAGINQVLDDEIIEAVCEKFNVIPDFVSFEEEAAQIDVREDEDEDVISRAPVVTVMGHVDHGKTSLLDYIRKTRVAAGEAGGITQHIGAYQVEVKGQQVVFIDTPGHEAFTRMRARGAEVTDIVILVVAADDGVMPQTIEAIDHAKAAGVPIIVAVNKIDKEGAQPDRVKKDLGERELIPEDWGGDTVFVEVSATEGTNIDLLLEMILLVTDLQELKANPRRSAAGVVLEAGLEKGRGAVATLLVQNGTLRTGDTFIAGEAYGRVRALLDDQGKKVSEAGPSSAVEVLGLQGMPEAGDGFQVVTDSAKAREIVEFRLQKRREDALAGSAKVSLEDLYQRMASGDVRELGVVLKADTQGSAEVLQDSLVKLSTEKVRVSVIRKGVGAITESDIVLASASDAIVVGFNVRPEPTARIAAENEEVEVRLYTVIYDVAKDVEKAMLGLLEPTYREKYLGRAEVRDTFKVPKFGTIAGSYVQDGVIPRKASVRLIRDNVVIHEGNLDSLRRFKDDANEVKAGYECGISIANYNDVKIGDVIEAFETEEVAPELN